LTNVYPIIKLFSDLSRRKALYFALAKRLKQKWLSKAILLQKFNQIHALLR